MEPRALLRVEGLVVFVAALAAFFARDGSLVVLAVLALAPDLSMAGYLAGPRVGAAAYNAVHTYVPGLALGAWGLLGGPELAVLGALVWVGHVGADRAVGYGLKYPDAFDHTHLG